MKCIAGHQPNLYPYGGFFAKAMCVDEFVIVDNVQYVKKEYNNRNKIKFSDGSAKWICIPVKNSGRYRQLIKDAEIDNSRDWRSSHIRTFELNYRKAPFYNEFFPIMESLLMKERTMLSEYNTAFIRAVFNYLNIRAALVSAPEKNISGSASELILELCRAAGAQKYLHGIHSLDYVDFSLLEKNGVESLIQYFQPPIYPQINGNFIENLSVIDIIFNCGKESAEILRRANTIKVCISSVKGHGLLNLYLQ